jgi:hypothetical protein
MDSRALRLELRMDASVQLVSVTRRFVESALEKVCPDDADLVARVAVATHELLENAARYSRKDGSPDRVVELSVTVARGPGDHRDRLALRLCNTTNPAHIDRLKKSFAELDACEDPLSLYVGLMRRNARDTSISGLGLARVRAEGEMTLGLSVSGDAVTIVAETPLSQQGVAA